MNSTLRRMMVPVLFLTLFVPMVLTAQQAQPPAPPQEETMMPQDFTNLLKEIWSFLKAETDTYLASIATKGEFETAREFERRVTDSRQQALARVIKYSRDQKLDQRSIAVLFKASLGTYNADKSLFPISSTTVIEAPYNIPTVQCQMRKNPYVHLADSIRSGYRTSSLYINLPKGHRWQVGRDLARTAKAEEENVFFRVKFMINIEKSDLKKQAILEFVPREIALVNNTTNKTFWTVPIR
jgi:hypothetical protein